jgi:hypothetical protein
MLKRLKKRAGAKQEYDEGRRKGLTYWEAGRIRNMFLLFK